MTGHTTNINRVGHERDGGKLMTPLQIMDDEICTKLNALAFFRKSFADVLFEREVPQIKLTDGSIYTVSKENGLRSAKELVHRTIKEIRYLRRIKERMQYCAKLTRERRTR